MKPSAQIGKRVGLHLLQFCQQFLVLAADQNQLQALLPPFSRFTMSTMVRSVSAKEHDSGRKMRIEAELLSLRRIHPQASHKTLPSSPCPTPGNVIAIVPALERLLLRSFRTADEIFRFRLDPEMRRIIREIGQQGYECRRGHALRMLSASARLKCGMTDSTRSAGFCLPILARTKLTVAR